MKACEAKTRRGGKCKARPMPNGRCRMHGGKSPAWFAHPNYKHGRYSKYSFEGVRERAERRRRALWRAFYRELDKLPEHVPFQLIQKTWRRVVREYEEKRARASKLRGRKS